MAQDTGLLSVRRPRETLGNLSHNNASAIPLPASALKRSSSTSNFHQPNPPHTSTHARSVSGSRMSLAPGRPSQPNFQRPSSGGNPAEMGAGGASTIQRNSSSNNNFMSNANAGGRKSQAFFGTATPAAPHTSSLQLGQSTQRRSSVWSSARQSSSMGQAGGGHQSFFTTAPAPAGVPRDPRPLREKTFQGQIAKELMDYLTQNNFEMDMKHSLTQNSLKSPTQKDFNNMFQWLYGRIDPNYRFYRSIDQEVPPILKQLRYPFEKNITRSQIAAVGGANWPSFLGVLHWMMQLARMMEGYNTGSYDDACIDAGYDITGDRIIFDFLTDAYHEWLAMEDDQEDKADEILRPHVNRMARQFDDANSKYVEQVKVLEAEHRALRDQVEELSRSGDLIAKLDKDHKTLADDKVKFDTFKSTMHEKQEKYEGRVNLIKNEIEKVEQEMEEVEQKRSELQAEVDKQGMTIDDIDRMNSERERLQKGVESTAQRLEDAKQKVSEKENDAGSRLDDLERSVLEYNGLGYQIGIIPATAANAKGGDYELSLKISTQTAPSSFRSSRSRSQSRQRSRASESPSPECQTIEERLLADSSTGYAPHQLLNLDIRGVVKNGITGLRKEVAEKKNASAETDLNNRDLLDKIREAIEDKQQEVEGLGHRVRAAEEEFEKTRDITASQKMHSDMQIEKLEKDLSKLRTNLTESVQLMEQREMNTNIEYEQLTVRAAALREELHTEVERILNDVIRFKVHVQRSLEEYESFVVEESEREIAEAEDEAQGDDGKDEADDADDAERDDGEKGD